MRALLWEIAKKVILFGGGLVILLIVHVDTNGWREPRPNVLSRRKLGARGEGFGAESRKECEDGD